MQTSSRVIIGLFAVSSLLSLLGCAQQKGPPRYSLDGSATLSNGKPIPVGEIMLEPDTAAGNQGPAAMAPIRDGKYSLPADQGVMGGKYIATITAFDGVSIPDSLQGKPLIQAPYIEKIDLPQSHSTKDFQLK